jgi:hypothetical protein
MWSQTICHGLKYVLHMALSIFSNFVNESNDILIEIKSTMCSHNTTSQKRHWTAKKSNQNWINIYVFPFKTLAILASYYFFIHINVKEFELEIHFMKI